MKLYIYDDGRESSIIHFLTTTYTNHTQFTEEENMSPHHLLGAHQKKRTSSNGRFARCQFLVRLIILELEKTALGKKRKDFHAKRHTF